MMNRLFALMALFATLTSCGDTGGSAGGNGALAGGDDRVDCALAGAPAFEPICTLERSSSDAGVLLTIRAPDGGFRRLLATGDGRGVIAADGAAPALVSLVSDRRIEVAIDADRYRLPATVKADAPPPK